MNDEFYWSLIIEPGWLQAGIWNIDIEEKETKIISIGSSTKWETEEDMVQVADAALSSAVQNLDDEAPELSKTVFGVPPSWVSDGQIKKEHLDHIKKICSNLSLSPTGFVVLPEAIAHSIRLNEGSPLTGVVIGVGESTLDLSIFKLGNLSGTVNVGRSVSLVDDVVEALARFATGEPLPSRFILYDGKSAALTDARSGLVEYDWGNPADEKIKFLHTPKVEVVTPEEKVAAVCAAGASEIAEIEKVSVSGVSTQNEQTAETFDSDVDGEEESNIVDTQDVSPEDLGFVMDEDIKKIDAFKVQSDGDMTNSENLNEGVVHKHSERKRLSFGFLSKLKMPKFKSKKQEGPVISSHETSHNRSLKRPLVIFSLLVVLAFSGAIVFWWFVPKAEVTIYVSPKTLEEVEEITLDENAPVADIENRLFPAEVRTVEVSGEKTKSSTGSKTVGERAKGTVTIRNGTSQGIKFASGTSLLGPNELKFTTDEEASVSAAVSPSEPGSVQIPVTAVTIGAEYNLAKDESLSVSNYPKSEVDAVVSTDLSGGSSRETVAVAKSDLTDLEDELTDELLQEAITQIQSQLGPTILFAKDALRHSIVDREFNHAAGDESPSVSLNMTISAVGVVVSKSTINSLARSILDSQVPSGYVLRDEQIQSTFNFIEELDTGVWAFETDLRANLLPEIRPDDIAHSIAGRRAENALEYLSTLSGYSRAEVKLRPKIPAPFNTIPRVLKNISVEVVADK